MANDSNNNDIKSSQENTGEPKAPKKRLNVVFRKQNSTSIKELPNRLKNAANTFSSKKSNEQIETEEEKPRKPRPLPAGTKPVKPSLKNRNSAEPRPVPDKRKPDADARMRAKPAQAEPNKAANKTPSADNAASNAGKRTSAAVIKKPEAAPVVNPEVSSAAKTEMPVAGSEAKPMAKTDAAPAVKAEEGTEAVTEAATVVSTEPRPQENTDSPAKTQKTGEGTVTQPKTIEKSKADKAESKDPAKQAGSGTDKKAGPSNAAQSDGKNADSRMDKPQKGAQPSKNSESRKNRAANAGNEDKKTAKNDPGKSAPDTKAEPAKRPQIHTLGNLSETAAPKIKIVKSYANYDAAAVIAEASRQARKESERARAAQKNSEGQKNGDGQKRQKQDSQRFKDQSQRGSQADGQKQQRASGQRQAAPGQRDRRPVTAASQGRGTALQSGGGSGAGRGFEGSQGKNQNQRGRNLFSGRDKKDRKDKYVDDLSAAQAKTKKGAFIKPEPRKEKPEEEIKVIVIPETLTIKELAEKLHLQSSAIVKKLFLGGKMVTPNTDLSYEEAEEIAMDYDILCEKEVEEDVIAELLKEEDEDESKLVARNPVVCVMGHVDHGKTSLLDAIRNTNVTSREAGGITQHIGASVVKAGDRHITFLDTPGHEAFTAMRLRGAQSTDIAVLVVAADDGVKPQTIEAINHAKAAEVEVIVAINKMDKPTANPEMVKNELAEYGIIPEEWGGKTPMVEVSAKTGQGIEDLLDIILLQADVMELRANPNRHARGLVIEAQLDKGRGPVATVLVQKGTLKVGDNVVAGACYGKVRAMLDDKHNQIKKALPSYPAEILGLNEVPNAGEVFMVCNDEKEARSIAETFIAEQKKHMLEETKKKMNLDDLFDEIKAGNIKELPIIVKADVQGSVEAVKQSLGKLSNDEVAVKVIHSAAGNINESDVTLASAANAIIIGFNVKPDPTAKSRAEQEKIDIRLYKVIYQAIEDLEAALTGMLAPVYEPQTTGRVIVRQIFKSSGVGIIAGCYVSDGVVERGSRARLLRGDKQIFDGDIASLKRFKDEVKEVKTGFECGIVLDDFSDIMVDDVMEIYKMVQVPRS